MRLDSITIYVRLKWEGGMLVPWHACGGQGTAFEPLLPLWAPGSKLGYQACACWGILATPKQTINIRLIFRSLKINENVFMQRWLPLWRVVIPESYENPVQHDYGTSRIFQTDCAILHFLN